MLDWTKPIEAVHTDGRAVSVRLDPQYPAPDDNGRYTLLDAPDSTSYYTYETNGRSWLCGLWSIRNVEPTLRTSDEALRRMEALVERLAAFKPIQGDVTIVEAPGSESFNLTAEARAIQALRTPIDPRLEPVVRSLVANGISEPVARPYARDVLKALDA